MANQQNIRKFYPLTADELLYLCQILTDTELKTLLYLKTIHPFTDNFKEVDTAAIAEQLNVTRRSIQRFLKKFKALGLIEWEVTKFKYKIIQLESDPRIAGATDGSPAYTPGSPERQTDRRHTLQDRQTNSETLPDKDSKSLHTIHTIHTIHTPQTIEEEDLNFDEKEEEQPPLTSLQEISLNEVLKPAVKKKQQKPRTANIPQDLINKLEELEIPLDEAVVKSIASHDISQAYGAASHVEKTWETINNPKSVFLYQISRQKVERLGAGKVYTAKDFGWSLDRLKLMYPHSWREAAGHFGVEIPQESNGDG